MTEILESGVELNESGGLVLSMMTLSSESKEFWVEFFNEIEAQIAKGGKYHSVKDIASKTSDNAVRLAALIEYFETGSTIISSHSMQCGAKIATWHLDEALRFFGELSLSDLEQDSKRLLEWILSTCQDKSCLEVSTRDLQRLGPIRQRKRLDEALSELENLSHIRLTMDDNKKLIKINPDSINT